MFRIRCTRVTKQETRSQNIRGTFFCALIYWNNRWEIWDLFSTHLLVACCSARNIRLCSHHLPNSSHSPIPKIFVHCSNTIWKKWIIKFQHKKSLWRVFLAIFSLIPLPFTSESYFFRLSQYAHFLNYFYFFLLGKFSIFHGDHWNFRSYTFAQFLRVSQELKNIKIKELSTHDRTSFFVIILYFVRDIRIFFYSSSTKRWEWKNLCLAHSTSRLVLKHFRWEKYACAACHSLSHSSALSIFFSIVIFVVQCRQGMKHETREWKICRTKKFNKWKINESFTRP